MHLYGLCYNKKVGTDKPHVVFWGIISVYVCVLRSLIQEISLFHATGLHSSTLEYGERVEREIRVESVSFYILFI